MDAIALMKGFSDKLKDSEKELSRLEKRAKTLAEKQATADTEREGIEAQINARELATEASRGTMDGLFEDWTRASFEGDTQAQAELQSKRAQLQQEIEKHEEDIRQLRERKSELADLSADLAEVAVQLEDLSFGNAYMFASKLRTELLQNESKLKSRQQKARLGMPRVGPELMESVRAEDEDYVARKQEQELSAQQARQQRVQQENDLKVKAGIQYRGAGQGGKPRAATIGEATEKIKATRGQ